MAPSLHLSGRGNQNPVEEGKGFSSTGGPDQVTTRHSSTCRTKVQTEEEPVRQRSLLGGAKEDYLLSITGQSW